jgi:succinate dehydrogenase/fumarate reductase flavoprotein subunit
MSAGRPIPDERIYECDIAVIGGGLGGVAAALAAVEAGKQVVLSAES